MVDEVGIIHMNGRIYDPKLARFLQADPFVQSPTNTQSLNRYSYVYNNPLNATDPSGYFVGLIAGAIALGLGAEAAAVAIIVGIVTAAQTLVMGGSFGDALIAGVSAAAMSYVGAKFALSDGGFSGFEALKFGTLGGITSSLQGGKFGHGFVAAGAGAYFGGKIGPGARGNTWASIGQTAKRMVLSGTISEATGGKFANGAAYAAFSSIVSEGVQAARQPTPQEVTYARLANGVYDPEYQGVDGYDKVGSTFIDDKTGLQSALFVSEATGHSVMAFAGTNGGSDWGPNIRQAFGKRSAQYSQALDQAQTVYANMGENVHFVGHSLGGALAAASAITTGGGATTFNAAGVHSNTVGGLTAAPGSITQFNSTFDVMQMGNALTPANARGSQISLGAAGVHGMGGVCRAMGC